MKHLKSIIPGMALLLAAMGCNNDTKKDLTGEFQPNDSAKVVFKLYSDENRFADIELLRYDVPGFDKLSLNQKLLVYYLSEAALCGRDINYDQNNRYNLRLRKTLEELYTHFEGDKNTDDFKRFEVYLKRIWVSNGIHHHYGENKLVPEFSSNYLLSVIKQSPKAALPLLKDKDTAGFKNWLLNLVFNPSVESKRVNKAGDVDKIVNSANNFYEGVNEKEVNDFYREKKMKDSVEPLSWGINSKLIKDDKGIREKVWKADGMYGAAISKMVEWLEKAITVAETEEQKKALTLLVKFYKTGSLEDWDNYNIAWVKDINSTIDVINGFIEVYHDAIGMRANYESAVEIKDFEASERMKTLGENAQFFEDNSPIDPQYKKAKVNGITYKVVNVAMEAGDLAPSTAIGINLPNAEWIRETHGSKSVSLGNIVDAYNKANSGGMLSEFCWDEAAATRAKTYGQLAAKMHTAMHEVIGHASGQMNTGVTKDDMGAYGSTLEEARADLVALYYMMDKKLVDLKLIPSLEVGKCEYDDYIRNGLMVQLRRLQEGENLEEDHMRNRQMVALWVYEAGRKDNVIEKKTRDGKTFFVINDYEKLRGLFGQLLNKIQTIKSTGNHDAGKELVETYGVKVNKDLHKEVLNRVKALDVAAYRGFIQPRYTPVIENGKIIDVKIDFTETFIAQMLRYGQMYGLLPLEN